MVCVLGGRKGASQVDVLCDVGQEALDGMLDKVYHGLSVWLNKAWREIATCDNSRYAHTSILIIKS